MIVILHAAIFAANAACDEAFVVWVLGDLDLFLDLIWFNVMEETPLLLSSQKGE